MPKKQMNFTPLSLSAFEIPKTRLSLRRLLSLYSVIHSDREYYFPKSKDEPNETINPMLLKECHAKIK
jgi:hypothetical protein